MNQNTSIVIIISCISLSISIGVSFYNYSISQIKDPVSMCFATATGEKEMSVCLKLKELTDNK
jgi:hypothetical protein